MQWYTPGGGIDLWEIDATDVGDGGLYVQWSANAGASTASYASNADVADGLWHHIRIDMTKSGGNAAVTVYLDNVSVISQNSGLAWSTASRVLVNPTGVPDEAVPSFGH